MTGPEHYQEAEGALAVLASGTHGGDPVIMASLAAVAQVHATLALAAATALAHPFQIVSTGMHNLDWKAWDQACGEQS